MRTLYGQPIRKETTETFYPDKISLEDFKEVINGFEAFVRNMENLGVSNKQKYIEEWVQTFLSWSEIETER